MKARRDSTPMGYSICHDRKNVGHRNVVAVNRFTFGDVTPGLVREEIGDLQSNRALLVGKVQPAHDPGERWVCLKFLKYASDVALVCAATLDDK